MISDNGIRDCPNTVNAYDFSMREWGEYEGSGTTRI